jgi:hypothetical protein
VSVVISSAEIVVIEGKTRVYSWRSQYREGTLHKLRKKSRARSAAVEERPSGPRKPRLPWKSGPSGPRKADGIGMGFSPGGRFAPAKIEVAALAVVAWTDATT